MVPITYILLFYVVFYLAERSDGELQQQHWGPSIWPAFAALDCVFAESYLILSAKAANQIKM